MSNYIERYWRDATPADAIKEPPMVARFKYEKSGKWKIELLLGFDRDGSEITWSGQSMRVHYCQVYDAPEPKYVPFEWEDREQLRGRWIVDCDGFEFMLVTMDEFAGRIGMTPTQPSKRTDSTPDREPDFKD